MVGETGPFFGGIEMGGTKIICGVASDPWNPLAKIEIPTATPEDSIPSVLEFFDHHQTAGRSLTSIGVGSFGPVDLVKGSPRFGELIDTPKPGWSGVNIAKNLAEKFGVDCLIDTDVNCALTAEAAAQDPELDNAAYVTIGTGVGVSLLASGKIVRGQSHSEFGHCFIPQHTDDREFDGVCPYHGNQCAEGLFSGPAISARASGSAKDIPEHDPIWNIVSDYLGTFCANLFYATAPDTIILGGGVMSRRFLFPKIRQSFVSKLNNYAGALNRRVEADDFIRPVALDGQAGLIGALLLAAGHAA
ncbi:MAG: ROK family protein [Parvularcula sp.]